LIKNAFEKDNFDSDQMQIIEAYANNQNNFIAQIKQNLLPN